MAIETTPLGFQKPDGSEAVRDGDNVIAANAQKADDLIHADRVRMTTIEEKDTAQDARLDDLPNVYIPLSRGVLAAGTDLNTLTGQQHVGTYSLSGTYPNAPEFPGTAVLEVQRGSGNSLSVVHRITAQSTMLWREAVDASAGTWSTWSQAQTTDTSWAPQRNVPSTQDLNTFKVPGVHRISTPDTATILNLPPGIKYACILENILTGTGSDVWWVQRVTQHGPTPRFAWRSTRDLVGGWNDWEDVLTDGGTPTELHVFLAVGQSNMSGRGLPAGGSRDPQSDRILQYGAKTLPRAITTATIPLDMLDDASGLSPATEFARDYLKTQPSHVGVLLIPAAYGGTGFTTSTTTRTWTPNVATDTTFDLPKLAVDQTTAAITAAKAAGHTVSLEGILWHQGEDNTSMSQTSYATNLDALISYFRTQLGSSKLPFVVGQMSPEGITANPGRVNIDAAHRDTPVRVPYTAFAAATSGGINSPDTTHFSRIGVKFLGRTYALGLQAAKTNADLWPRMAAVEAKQAIKCVRLESGKWVWDTTAGTHYVMPDDAGGLVIRATPWPAPNPTKPELTW